MTQFVPLPRVRRFSGPEKSAILFLCLGEERGGALMQQLEDEEIRKITAAISNMGEIQSHLVEEVMDEFGVKLSDYGGIVGSVSTARAMLNSFLPTERVDEILKEIHDSSTGDLWSDLSKMDEKTLAQLLKKERDQTVAVILSRLNPDATAKILPLLGQTRAAQLVERILTLDQLPENSVRNLEDSLRREVLSKAGQSASADTEAKLVSIFNKLDRDMFEEISRTLEKSSPEKLKSIKQKMFVFDDLIRLDPMQLARVMREVSGTTLPYALRGARKEVRDHMLNSLPARTRDMLQEEMTALGPVKSRRVKQAQSELIEATMRLARDGEISLEDPEDDEDGMV
jgi:flagellar motor switch protein FliG